MDGNKKYRTLIFQLTAFIVMMTVAGSSISASSADGISASFVKNNTQVETNEVASNVLRLKNNSSKTVSFVLSFSIPGGWNVLGKSERVIEINPHDSVFTPVRIISEKISKGGTNYIVTASLKSESGVLFATQNWYVGIPSRPDWSVHLPVKQQFFINGIDSSGFLVRLSNQGNTDEEIRLLISPDRRLDVLRNGDGSTGNAAISVSLPVGADTTLAIPVICRPKLTSQLGRDADLKHDKPKEDYSVQLIAKSTTSKNSWSGTMQFTKAVNVIRVNEFSRNALPLTLEANVYDVLSNGTTMALDAYGNTNVGKNGLLNYRFQTVFVTNYLQENSFLGNNHYIGYLDDKSSLELGEINGWSRSLLTGKGIKGSHRFGINTIGAMYARSPGFFSDNHFEGYGFYHNITVKKISLSNFYSHNQGASINLGNDIYNSLASYKISNYHQISAGGGYSVEHANNLAKTGYGYDLNYSGAYKKLSLYAGGSYGSPIYALARGVIMYSTSLSFNNNNRYNYTLSTQNFSQHPDYYLNGNLIHGNYVRSDRYELRIGVNSTGSTVYFKPTYQWEENPMIRIATRSIGFEYNAKGLTHTRFSANGSFGYAKAVDYSEPDFFVSKIGIYTHWDNTVLSLRYTYGAGQLAEQKRFINDHINPQSVYLVVTHDKWMMNDKVLLSTNGNIMYETYFKKVNVRIRPELFYYAKNGVRFSFYYSFVSSRQGANPLLDDVPGRLPFEKTANTEMNIGFGVRKQIGIPVPGKRFASINALIFKDLNGNHIQDKGEEGIENVLVNIKPLSIDNAPNDSAVLKYNNGEDLISNQMGEISYVNIPAGMYSVKCTSLVSQGEWFNSGTIEYKADSKKKLLIPFTRGVRLNGALLIERDKYSSQSTIDLSRIRITAIDSSGKTFSVLTNLKGEFTMNLPASHYTLSVNEGALGDNLIFEQSRIDLDLSNDFANFNISFNAVEKKRTMKIKKFNSDGSEKKE